MKRTHLDRFLLLAVLIQLLVGCVGVRPDYLLVAQDLGGDHTWSGEVRVLGDIVVEERAHLRILPGTKVLFLPPGNRDRFSEHPNFSGSELIVNGRVTAEGTAEKPIIFRYIDPLAPAGSWGGINVVESFDSSFAYVVIRQADSAIHSQDSRVYIEQSIIEENLVGIRFHTSQILIENNLIRNNGSGIRFHFGQPVICKNEIIGNGKGIFITSHPRNYLIENNTIRDNLRAVVLGEEVPADVVMPRNYWGTADVKTVRSGFFDGQIEPYLGVVNITPLRPEPDPDSGPNWTR